MLSKDEIKELDEIFEDENSYTGPMLKEDHLFEVVLAWISSKKKIWEFEAYNEGYISGEKDAKDPRGE